MPVPPAELTAQYTVEGGEPARDAARAAATATGLARDAGPRETALSGARDEVVGALAAVVDAAFAAGARRMDVRLDAPTEARG
jgi:uncharacterized protein YqgV (UPF0045/DUF77 family)